MRDSAPLPPALAYAVDGPPAAGEVTENDLLNAAFHIGEGT